MNFMRCGHTANAVKDGKPCCAICIGINPGATEVSNLTPTLTNRMSRCPHCQRVRPSDMTLPFFEYLPEREYDMHYDGCRGWD